MPFGLYLGTHAQPVVHLCLHLVLAGAWNEFLCLRVSFCEANEFALGNVVFSVPQLGLPPRGMGVIIALCWLCFVLYYFIQTLVC